MEIYDINKQRSIRSNKIFFSNRYLSRRLLKWNIVHDWMSNENATSIWDEGSKGFKRNVKIKV